MSGRSWNQPERGTYNATSLDRNMEMQVQKFREASAEFTHHEADHRGWACQAPGNHGGCGEESVASKAVGWAARNTATQPDEAVGLWMPMMPNCAYPFT